MRSITLHTQLRSVLIACIAGAAGVAPLGQRRMRRVGVQHVAEAKGKQERAMRLALLLAAAAARERFDATYLG